MLVFYAYGPIYLIRNRNSRIQPQGENELTGVVRIPSFIVLEYAEGITEQPTENTIEHGIQTFSPENTDHAQFPNKPSTSTDTRDIAICSIESNIKINDAQYQLNDEMHSTKRRNEQSPEDTLHEARQHQDRGNDLDNDLHQITKMLLAVTTIHTCTYLFSCVTRVIWPISGEDVEDLGFVINILQKDT